MVYEEGDLSSSGNANRCWCWRLWPSKTPLKMALPAALQTATLETASAAAATACTLRNLHPQLASLTGESNPCNTPS
ncbi:hypothetical protein HKD37_20G056460 [Glycine soja]